MGSSKNITLPVLPADADRSAGTRMGRRRAIVLVIVHVVVLLHILHYLSTGSTISPLEPSEAGHSLRTGAINAGAIFLVVLIGSTLVLGRFFCGWACHVVAYQDLARWILVKVGLRPQPVRTRLLMFVPLFAVFWLYVRPLVARWTDPGPSAGLSLHLTTDEFWATFPGVTVSILTFAVCGFVIVYVLGAKGFCTYGCPYGALFGISDRFARGRIRVNESCEHTGQCTRNCSSNVDVAREVASFGAVTDPGCMKCMDCVAGCPNDALYYGFASTTAGTGAAAGPGKAEPAARRRDFTWPEEIFLAGAFAAVFWIVFDQYRTVPFLLAIGLAVIAAFLALTAVRLFSRRDVIVQRLVFKWEGRLTGAGRLFAVACGVMLVGAAHGALIQWHTRRAVSAYDEARRVRYEMREAGAAGDAAAALEADYAAAASGAARHLAFCETWGLLPTRGADRMRGELARWRGDGTAAIARFDAELGRGSRNRNVHMYRGLALVDIGRFDEARAAFERAFEAARPPANRFRQLDWELRRIQEERADVGRVLRLRIDMLRLAVDRHPADGDFALRLCRLLVRPADPALADRGEALRTAERVSAANGRSHADLLAMLAWLYGQSGRWAEAVTAAEDSLRVAREQGLDAIAEQMAEAVDVYRRMAAEAAADPG